MADHRSSITDGTASVVVVAATSSRREVAIVDGGGCAEAIVWPGMGARWRSFHQVALETGGRTIVLHHASEAVYFVMTGDAEIVNEATGQRSTLPQGSMVHVGPACPYRLVGATATAIVGGPCPPDPTWYGEGGALPEFQDPATEEGTIRVFHRD